MRIMLEIALIVCLCTMVANASGRLDFWDEAGRLFVTADGEGKLGPSATERGQRDYEAAQFALDFVDRKCGDLSVMFLPDKAPDATFVGFTPGPYQQSWAIDKSWSVHLWLLCLKLNLEGSTA